MKLNTTREERDEWLVGDHDSLDCIGLRDAYEDCNALEDELARVREELESARRVIERARESADAEKEGHWGNYKGISSVEALRAAIVDHRERFGGRDGLE